MFSFIFSYFNDSMSKLPTCVRNDPSTQEKTKPVIAKTVDAMYVSILPESRKTPTKNSNRFLLAQLYLDSLDDDITLKIVESALVQFEKQSKGPAEDNRPTLLSQLYEQAMGRTKGQKLGFHEPAEYILV